MVSYVVDQGFLPHCSCYEFCNMDFRISSSGFIQNPLGKLIMTNGYILI